MSALLTWQARPKKLSPKVGDSRLAGVQVHATTLDSTSFEYRLP